MLLDALAVLGRGTPSPSTLPWILVVVFAIYLFWDQFVSIGIIVALFGACDAFGKHMCVEPCNTQTCDGGDRPCDGDARQNLLWATQQVYQ